MDNSIVRLQMKQKRQGLSDEDLNALSFSCFQLLIQQESFSKANKVGIYMDTNHEVQTKSIIEYLWKHQKEVYVPKCKQDGIMDFYQIKSFLDVHEGKYHILEPNENCKMDNDLDLIICPLVAFDTTNNRLGMGKGYYDRFLEKYPTSTIGLAFEIQKANFQVFSHDQKLDCIITDKEVYIWKEK